MKCEMGIRMYNLLLQVILPLIYLDTAILTPCFSVFDNTSFTSFRMGAVLHPLYASTFLEVQHRHVHLEVKMLLKCYLILPIQCHPLLYSMCWVLNPPMKSPHEMWHLGGHLRTILIMCYMWLQPHHSAVNSVYIGLMRPVWVFLYEQVFITTSLEGLCSVMVHWAAMRVLLDSSYQVVQLAIILRLYIS